VVPFAKMTRLNPRSALSPRSSVKQARMVEVAFCNSPGNHCFSESSNSGSTLSFDQFRQAPHAAVLIRWPKSFDKDVKARSSLKSLIGQYLLLFRPMVSFADIIHLYCVPLSTRSFDAGPSPRTMNQLFGRFELYSY